MRLPPATVVFDMASAERRCHGARIGDWPRLQSVAAHGDDLIRAWYLTNGSDVALVTYVVAAASGNAAAELADAGAIVRSIDFG